MSMYSDVAKLIELSEKLRSKGNGGIFDEWFLEKYKAKRFGEWGPFAKLMKCTYFIPFARKQIMTGLRNDFYDVKESLIILNARYGPNVDCKNALDLADNYLKSLAKPLEKKWDKKTYLYFVLAPSVLGLPSTLVSLHLEWILPLLVLGSIAILLPLFGGLGASNLATKVMEVWWNKHWRKELGIDVLKNKIVEKAMRYANSDSYL